MRPEPDAQELMQIGMFAPISAVSTHVVAVSPWDEPMLDWTDDEQHMEWDLAPPPPPPASALLSEPNGTRTLREAKNALRAANATAARDLARVTGQPHSMINAELNRQAGIRRISEATAAQLQRRLDAADRWLLAQARN